MLIKKRFLLLFSGAILGLFSALSLAEDKVPTDTYYESHEQGWHWYQDSPSEIKANQQVQLQNPVAQMDSIKQAIKTALDKAILTPTADNVHQYMMLQNQWMNKASRFSAAWQQVLLQYPDLDYSLKAPTNQIGREVYLQQTQAKEEEAIYQLATHSGLFFFYKSTCPYCQRFAPILKDFAARYHITVIPVTTDGIPLPEFPDSRVDQGQAAKFNVTVEPALFTVDPYTHQAVPVSYGLLSEEELKARILAIAENLQEKIL